MRIIPSFVSANVRSQGERKVFQLLRDIELGDECVALHSLNLSEHHYKIVSELDFVVLTPGGIFVLEVKGGHVARKDGIWVFTNRYGHEHRRSEGPFEQARSGMFALKERLTHELGESELCNIVWGFGTLFPDCEFDISSVEWARAMVFDAHLYALGLSGFETYLKELTRYWTDKVKNPAVLDAPQIRRLRSLLRPNFERVPSLRVRAAQVEESIVTLTSEQFSYLDAVEDNPRILCSGGAGTGKTFLAMELARRWATRGHTVLLACASPTLASFLVSRVPDNVRVEVMAHDLPDDTEPVDYLIVDEGQDVLNFASLDLLDARVRGGLKDGHWCVFYDSNAQAGLLGAFDTEALALLESLGIAKIRLKRNCRNTLPIVTQTRLITGADLGNPAAGEGPSIQTHYYRSLEEQVAQLEVELRRLRSEGVADGEITALTPGDPRTSSLARFGLIQRFGLRLFTPDVARGWPISQPTVSSITEFKGLENNFILIADVESFATEGRPRNLIYVGMTRARVGLWLGIHESLRQRIATTMQANLPRVVSANG